MPLPLDGPPRPDGADCVSCGRCCHHGPSTVHLLDTDEARVLARAGGAEILRRLTVVDERPPRHSRPVEVLIGNEQAKGNVIFVQAGP